MEMLDLFSVRKENGLTLEFVPPCPGKHTKLLTAFCCTVARALSIGREGQSLIAVDVTRNGTHLAVRNGDESDLAVAVVGSFLVVDNE